MQKCALQTSSCDASVARISGSECLKSAYSNVVE